MSDLLNSLRIFDALRDEEAGGDLVYSRVLDSIPPDYALDHIIKGLGERLRVALDKRGIKRLYQHQSEAIAQALEGANVVLQAPLPAVRRSRFRSPCLNRCENRVRMRSCSIRQRRLHLTSASSSCV